MDEWSLQALADETREALADWQRTFPAPLALPPNLRLAMGLLAHTAAAVPEPVTARTEDYRSPSCVEAWPGASTCEYDPSCCRFPKSCSAGEVYRVAADHTHTWEEVAPYLWRCTTCTVSGHSDTAGEPPTPRLITLHDIADSLSRDDAREGA